ncbi:MAG: cytochrome c biogenesis protein CcdA [Acidimicrobiales bacterium]|nr:cytochrome c biogenesis protein CcdA [Acidimicrobiales bacterium]
MIDVSLTLPFTLGIVTAINPCGFAMLPTWLGYFLGRDSADSQARPEQVLRGLSVSLVLTAAFVMVFGALGLAVNTVVSEEAVATRTPWVTVVLGVVFVPYGLLQLTGRQVRIPYFKPSRGPSSREIFSVLGFGASYAVVSIGCSAPIFLLHVADSFSRDGIVDGIAIYLAFAAGMAAVVTSLTLSLAIARGGLVRRLRRLLPYFERITALALTLGGAYLIVYGVYEIRILRNPRAPSNPIVDAVGDLQSHLTNWAAHVGGLRLGLALWLVVVTLVAWGLGPALVGKARKWMYMVVAGVWVVTEGLIHRGDLLVLPVGRLISNWPGRVGGWFDNPGRWATPLEALLTITFLLVAFALIYGTISDRRR